VSGGGERTRPLRWPVNRETTIAGFLPEPGLRANRHAGSSFHLAEKQAFFLGFRDPRIKHGKAVSLPVLKGAFAGGEAAG